MKKILVWAVVGVMAFTMVPASASAHHSRSGSGYRTCTISNCTRTGTHYHNGTCYGGHYNGDGHGHKYGRHH